MTQTVMCLNANMTYEIVIIKDPIALKAARSNGSEMDDVT